MGLNKKKIIILSGGYDPLHSGHIDMFKNAKSQCDWLVVCVNSDAWLKNKKGINFLDEEERLNIIKTNKYVNEAFIFEDDEFGSAINGIKKVISQKQKYEYMFREVTSLDYGEIYMEEGFPEIEFAFANGGDRNPNSTPSLEQKFCEENGIELLWNVGGDKSNSSSWILDRYRDSHFEVSDRVWGRYKVLYRDRTTKIKTLEVSPHRSLCLQSHKHRSEHWVVSEGVATVLLETEKYRREETVYKNESIYVPIGAKHKLINNTNSLLRIVEVQIGDYLEEDDIIRYESY